MDKKKILYVTSELTPYFAENNLSKSSLEAAKRMQESGHDVRVFMPRFGVINERRHQLHEVIRLSGMNIVVNDIDQPLIIKVASVPGAKLQAYFIDNEEYFKRKAVYGNDETPFFKDNDERLIFFARGVLETVKKLNWSPDIIHVQGWFGALLPLYTKTLYKNEPIFSNSKIVCTLYDHDNNETLDNSICHKIMFDGIDEESIKTLSNPTFKNLNKIGADYSDGITEGINGLSEDLKSISHANKMTFKPIEETKEAFLAFYSNQILEVKEV